MNTNIEAFLAHYGVLGMHWGHRKAEALAAPNDSNSEAWKKDQKRKMKNVLTIAGTAALAAGVIFASRRLGGAQGKQLVSTLKSKVSTLRGADKAVNVLKDGGSVPLSKIDQYRKVADSYKKNPELGEWLKKSAPKSYVAIMSLATG